MVRAYCPETGVIFVPRFWNFRRKDSSLYRFFFQFISKIQKIILPFSNFSAFLLLKIWNWSERSFYRRRWKGNYIFLQYILSLLSLPGFYSALFVKFCFIFFGFQNTFLVQFLKLPINYLDTTILWCPYVLHFFLYRLLYNL